MQRLSKEKISTLMTQVAALKEFATTSPEMNTIPADAKECLMVATFAIESLIQQVAYLDGELDRKDEENSALYQKLRASNTTITFDKGE